MRVPFPSGGQSQVAQHNGRGPAGSACGAGEVRVSRVGACCLGTGRLPLANKCLPFGNECPPPSGVHELALVEDVGAGAHQGRQVRVGVVAAEEQAPARRHGDADPRPRPAGVAAVGSSQSGFGDCSPFESRSVHTPITHHQPPRPHDCSPVAQSPDARRAPGPPRTPHIRPGSGRVARRCARRFLP